MLSAILDSECPCPVPESGLMLFQNLLELLNIKFAVSRGILRPTSKEGAVQRQGLNGTNCEARLI